MTLIKSKERVAEHGEVFTPATLVTAMLDQLQEETERIDSRFLEPACGSGNFLVQILSRKLSSAEKKYGHSEFDRRQYSLLGLMCSYGIELLADNVEDCRNNLLSTFKIKLSLSDDDPLTKAAAFVLTKNVVQGNALSMITPDGEPITLPEWGYIGQGLFQQRDFRYDTLTQSSAFSAEDSLFAHLSKHEIFTPVKTYKPATIKELATKDTASPRNNKRD